MKTAKYTFDGAIYRNFMTCYFAFTFVCAGKYFERWKIVSSLERNILLKKDY